MNSFPIPLQFVAIVIIQALLCPARNVDADTWPSTGFKACKVHDGRDGVCINLEKDVIRCATLRKMLLSKNFTDFNLTVCEGTDFEHRNNASVCCAIDEYVELYPPVNESLEMHDNIKLLPSLTDSDCGKSLGSTSDRIIGGTSVPPGVHPWMVRLGFLLPDEDRVRFICSGSILNKNYILSAAHCFKHGKLQQVRLAETDENTEKECIEVGIDASICQGVEDHQPEDIIIHSNYTGNVGSANDIALIRLKQPIQNLSSPFTKPVCLPLVDEFQLPDLENNVVSATGVKNFLHVQGWGKESNEENVGSTNLQEVLVPLRSNVYCRHVYRKSNLSISDEQICAGGVKNKGSCAGDSGSPLLLYSHSLNKPLDMRMFQIGIVSYGRNLCGLENSPVVYTRVRSFLKWILDNIKQ